MAKRNKNRRNLAPTVQKAYLSPTGFDVDVVIPVYGKVDLLKKCLDSLPRAMVSLKYRVIIVDNATPEKDQMVVLLNNYRLINKDMVAFRFEENRGFPMACNFGAQRGRSPYIFFLNTDIELAPECVFILYQDMEANQKLAMIGPKLLFPENTPHGPEGKIQHAGLDMNIRGEINHTFIGWSADHPKANIPCEPYGLTGAALLIRRKVWKDAGGFFEGYGLGTWEDVDLCVVVKKMGYNILYEPHAVATHWVGASATTYKVQYPLTLNRQIFMMRHQEDIYWSEWERL